MQKITTFLWFDGQALDAAKYYISIFKKNSRIVKLMPGEGREPLCVTFQLNGQKFMAMNGGPGHKLTDAISLLINCKTQREVDYYWNRLTKGGKGIACGWLKDKYGLTWQVTPTILIDLMSGKDRAKAGRVMQAMMKMVKIDIAKLKKAAAAKN